jgi:hypothetical protein
MTEVIGIYAQHTHMAGNRAHRWEPGDDNDDMFPADVTEAAAERFEALAKVSGAGSDLFYMRCAATVREALL